LTLKNKGVSEKKRGTEVGLTMESYELMFELSHKVRLDSIQLLQKEPKRLSSIANELDITTSEASRHLERLCKANIIEKKADSNYHLTPFGKIILLDLPKIRFLTNNITYFQTHDLSPIPIDIQSLDPISKSNFSHGTLENISIIEDVTSEAEKFVWSMTDQIFRGLKKQIAKKLDMGIEFKMIFPGDVVIPKEYERKKGRNVEIRTLNYVELALKLNEQRAGIALPDLTGNIDYSEVLVSENEFFHRWIYFIFEHYWNLAKPIY
jgi:predicted transcriptional regulator